MITVILGAGASYDSSPALGLSDGLRHAWRPPLAADLFQAHEEYGPAIDSYPMCRPLIYHMRELSAGVGLEEELDRLVRESEKPDWRLQRQLTALKYYLWWVLWHSGNRWLDATHGITNQVRLADRLDAWAASNDDGVAWIDFNYDRLIDQALKDVTGNPLTSSSDYLDCGRHRLFKPHGSVNWGHPVRFPGAARATGGTGDWIGREVIQRLSEVTVLPEFRMGHHMESTPACIPAITIPIRQKALLECLDSHVQAMTDSLRRSDRFLLVGWRATEGHFLKLWRQVFDSRARICIVAGSEQAASEVELNLQRGGIVAQATYTSETGFTDYVRGGLDSLFA